MGEARSLRKGWLGTGQVRGDGHLDCGAVGGGGEKGLILDPLYRYRKQDLLLD
jgi:hypothetical protein